MVAVFPARSNNVILIGSFLVLISVVHLSWSQNNETPEDLAKNEFSCGLLGAVCERIHPYVKIRCCTGRCDYAYGAMPGAYKTCMQ